MLEDLQKHSDRIEMHRRCLHARRSLGRAADKEHLHLAAPLLTRELVWSQLGSWR